MRQSKFFTKTKKEITKEEEALNAKLLLRAGFINKEMAGVYSFLPMGLRVLNKISNIVRDEMDNSLDAKEVLMSALHPLQNYKKTGRDDMDVLFHTTLNSGGDLVLGPTHEEIVVPLFQQFASSYKDLPCGIYQIQFKFRNELRAKSGILRGREFLMKDLYSFHETQDCFDKYYEKAQEVYHQIYKKLGLGDITYLTFASGGTFSKYSHEFQMISSVGEDEIYLCEACNIAVNKEIIDDVKGCPQCGKPKKELRIEKAIEMGNIFPLGTKFSDALKLKVKNKEGKEVVPIMGCYGIGISRVMGAVVEIMADEKGIIWPKEIAPYTVHLVSIKGSEEKAEEVYNNLRKDGIEVLFDDRDCAPGEKFADCDLIGVPYRIVVGKKAVEEDLIEVKKRDKEDLNFVKISNINQYVQKIIR